MYFKVAAANRLPASATTNSTISNKPIASNPTISAETRIFDVKRGHKGNNISCAQDSECSSGHCQMDGWDHRGYCKFACENTDYNCWLNYESKRRNYELETQPRSQEKTAKPIQLGPTRRLGDDGSENRNNQKPNPKEKQR